MIGSWMESLRVSLPSPRRFPLNNKSLHISFQYLTFCLIANGPLITTHELTHDIINYFYNATLSCVEFLFSRKLKINRENALQAREMCSREAGFSIIWWVCTVIEVLFRILKRCLSNIGTLSTSSLFHWISKRRELKNPNKILNSLRSIIMTMKHVMMLLAWIIPKLFTYILNFNFWISIGETDWLNMKYFRNQRKHTQILMIQVT